MHLSLHLNLTLIFITRCKHSFLQYLVLKMNRKLNADTSLSINANMDEALSQQ